MIADCTSTSFLVESVGHVIRGESFVYDEVGYPIHGRVHAVAFTDPDDAWTISGVHMSVKQLNDRDPMWFQADPAEFLTFQSGLKIAAYTGSDSFDAIETLIETDTEQSLAIARPSAPNTLADILVGTPFAALTKPEPLSESLSRLPQVGDTDFNCLIVLGADTGHFLGEARAIPDYVDGFLIDPLATEAPLRQDMDDQIVPSVLSKLDSDLGTFAEADQFIFS